MTRSRPHMIALSIVYDPVHDGDLPAKLAELVAADPTARGKKTAYLRDLICREYELLVQAREGK